MTAATSTITGSSRAMRRLRHVLVVTAVLALVLTGASGVFQYVRTYWLYRGFAPPSTPQSVFVRTPTGIRRVPVIPGSQVRIEIPGAAIGGHREPAYVFLPPGYYQHPTERYPVMYLLHGAPGGAINFVRVVDMGIVEAILVAEGRARPMILVSPTGSPSLFADEEWANGVRPGNAWETYVARDVVGTIDRRFRTIRSGADRAIGGLSEGGYGALNIAFHHPGEFRVIESWSGYMTAERVPAVWGIHPKPGLLAYNSPQLQVRKVAALLRRDHTYIWFYCGTSDPLLAQNRQFATLLSQLKIPSRFEARSGGHSWALWRSMVEPSLLAFSQHLGNGG